MNWWEVDCCALDDSKLASKAQENLNLGGFIDVL